MEGSQSTGALEKEGVVGGPCPSLPPPGEPQRRLFYLPRRWLASTISDVLGFTTMFSPLLLIVTLRHSANKQEGIRTGTQGPDCCPTRLEAQAGLWLGGNCRPIFQSQIEISGQDHSTLSVQTPRALNWLTLLHWEVLTVGCIVQDDKRHRILQE